MSDRESLLWRVLEGNAEDVAYWTEFLSARDEYRAARAMVTPEWKTAITEEFRQIIQRGRCRHLLRPKNPNDYRVVRAIRTPRWADLNRIAAVYEEARRRTAETGIEYHVDHEIPLRGRLVSGLHVHDNLQILTRLENSKKRNRFEVE